MNEVLEKMRGLGYEANGATIMDRRFEDLALYHTGAHLPLCVASINSGNPSRDGKEARDHDGILILENGPQTITDLVQLGLVNPEMISPQAQRVTDRTQLFSYLQAFGGEDGLHVHDTSNGLMYHVYSANNDLALKAAAQYLPAHFLGNRPLEEGKIGNRTRLAVHLPREVARKGANIQAYMIKQTPVNGIGTLSHFTEGLVEFMYRSPGVIGDGTPEADVAQAIWTYEQYGQNGDAPKQLESRFWSVPSRELDAVRKLRGVAEIVRGAQEMEPPLSMQSIEGLMRRMPAEYVPALDRVA